MKKGIEIDVEILSYKTDLKLKSFLVLPMKHKLIPDFNSTIFFQHLKEDREQKTKN